MARSVNSENNQVPEKQPEAPITDVQEPAAIDIRVEDGINRLMEVIDSTVDQIGTSEEERNLLREGVSNVVREALFDIANPPSRKAAAFAPASLAVESQKIGDTTDKATAAAVTGAREVGASFVTFTQGLITGTFNSVIKATIDQMKAYTDMVADLTKSLKEFAIENVSETAIDAKLKSLTFKDEDNQFYAVAEGKPKRVYHLKRLYNLAPYTDGQKKVILEVFGINEITPDPDDTKAVDDELDKIQDSELSLIKYDVTEIQRIKTAIKLGLAKNGMNQLRQMARDGMARIVVTEGEIRTKLTFSIDSNESNTVNSTDIDSESYGGSLNLGANWGWGNGSLNAYYNKLKVKTVNENSVSNIQLSTEMIGEVKIKFKTDYLPLASLADKSDTKESDLALIR